MSPGSYPPPIDKLLTYGNAWEMTPWPDYRALGLGPEHIPDLIRLAIDPELYEAETYSLAVWAPAHAWRALGQLGAVEAAEPLTGLFRRIDEDDDDFINEDLPLAFGLIGEGCWTGSSFDCARAVNGIISRECTGMTVRSTDALSCGARWACSRNSGRSWSKSVTS